MIVDRMKMALSLSPWVFAAALIIGSGGCGTTAPQKRHVEALQQKLEELTQKEASNNRRIEDLNTRLFLLEERFDPSDGAGRSANAGVQEEPPRLPVVRLGPEGDDIQRGSRATQNELHTTTAPALSERGEDSSINALDSEPDDSAAESVVADERVEYNGDALAQGPRPVLRLRGSKTMEPAIAEGVDANDTEDVAVRLPVVPVSDKGVVHALAREAEDREDPVLRVYQEALKTYRAGHAKVAAKAFQQFIRRHSTHEYAQNALYWLGECHYDLKAYKRALELFHQVVRQYPNGNKAPDALLKVAFSHLKLRDEKNAHGVFAQLVKAYPRSRAARMAKDALTKLEKPQAVSAE